MNKRHIITAVPILALGAFLVAQADPVVSRAGGSLPGLTTVEKARFAAGLAAFQEEDGVAQGLGPRFNSTSCAGCHAAPAIGGTSPRVNPQIIAANANGATNTIPPFITANGPVREVRFRHVVDVNGDVVQTMQNDGGVHALFTITGRADAPGCNIAQPNFNKGLAQNNLSFRIPTPVFGAGLIESIADSDILQSAATATVAKNQMGIGGHANRGAISGVANRSGNDGSITRFGWKAQNKSLLIFAGEAYNVEQGVTNELFPNERDTEPTALPDQCYYNGTPEDNSHSGTDFGTVSGDTVKFATFMRMLAPPAPTCDSFKGSSCEPHIQNGRRLFISTGCALCHTPELPVSKSFIAAISSQKSARLFSDLLLHDMGAGLADGVSQGGASGSEFRTAPLWGVGQRIFFLHDGRTSSLNGAIQEHASNGSEANQVIQRYNNLSNWQKQDLINFLGSL
jgi:CxxC motif-containing protein (DUF1111 family)